VLTTKNEKSAKRQLSLLNLDQYFVDVFGTTDDSRYTSKDARWREAERQLGGEQTSRISLIVGDRASDVVAAKNIGRLAIGATWGYGTSGELLEASADRIANAPLEVPLLIQEMLD
jgi:phosphoglycolate phosphatase